MSKKKWGSIIQSTIIRRRTCLHLGINPKRDQLGSQPIIYITQLVVDIVNLLLREGDPSLGKGRQLTLTSLEHSQAILLIHVSKLDPVGQKGYTLSPGTRTNGANEQATFFLEREVQERPCQVQTNKPNPPLSSPSSLTYFPLSSCS